MRKTSDARRKIGARGKKKRREMRTPCWQEAAGPQSRMRYALRLRAPGCSSSQSLDLRCPVKQSRITQIVQSHWEAKRVQIKPNQTKPDGRFRVGGLAS